MRAKLEGMRLTAPLFDTKRWVLSFEDALGTMWKAHLVNERERERERERKRVPFHDTPFHDTPCMRTRARTQGSGNRPFVCTQGGRLAN